MKSAVRWLTASLCLSLLSCSPTDDGNATVYREDDPPVSPFSADDEAMNRAMQRARDTLDEYRHRLANPPPTQTGLSLKAKFESGGHVEHMWVHDVEPIDGGFRGILGNTPLSIETLKEGDSVEISDSDVSDWMAIDDGRLVAGYTLRVIRDRMPADERAAFDAQMEFSID
jgi:uncharacterized protein YegJ (DUF2314 family)